MYFQKNKLKSNNMLTPVTYFKRYTIGENRLAYEYGTICSTWFTLSVTGYNSQHDNINL